LRGAAQIQKTANDLIEARVEVPDCAAAVSPDGRAVVFRWSVRGRGVEGAVARTLRTFQNGRKRIVAVAQRKWLAPPDEPLWLTVNDFVARRAVAG
jgi:hypothetical protein